MMMKENFGSLIFETPPKGHATRSFYKMDSCNFFMDRIELSPTPLKVEVEERQEMVINLLSPSKVMIQEEKN